MVLAIRSIAACFLLTGMACYIVPAPAHAADEAALWQSLRSGEAFAILRHELAPGTGDPDNFQIGDCSTQRNLNDTGKKRARATGDRFRANGIASAEVYSSQWCRCRETAQLLELGEVNDLPALNSFYENDQDAAPRTGQLQEWLSARDPGKPLVLVTHQVNIRALTGQPASSGQILVIRLPTDDRIEVLGKL